MVSTLMPLLAVKHANIFDVTDVFRRWVSKREAYVVRSSDRRGAPSQGGVPRRPQRKQNPFTQVRALPNPSVPKHAAPSSQHSEPWASPHGSSGRQRTACVRIWPVIGGGRRGINPALHPVWPSEAANRHTLVVKKFSYVSTGESRDCHA
jgi:hypothetical protein